MVADGSVVEIVLLVVLTQSGVPVVCYLLHGRTAFQALIRLTRRAVMRPLVYTMWSGQSVNLVGLSQYRNAVSVGSTGAMRPTELSDVHNRPDASRVTVLTESQHTTCS